jgi:hypothetical protein
MIDFPASPTVGQQFTATGVTWVWDGVKWAASGLSVAYVPLAGFVPAMNDNRIINGDMRIDQRWNGASGTANGYTIDRWVYNGSVASQFVWQRTTAAPHPQFPYSLGFRSASAHPPVAADFFLIQQVIEADMISDFAFGGASAQSITLSFWAQSSVTGTFSGSLQNIGGTTRSYPFTFSLPAANTWTKVAVTIPGDTAGTWALSGNSGGALLSFDLGCGANFRASAGAWATGNYVGATGAANVVATNAATFYLTGVKLEIGSVATPYNRQSLAKSLADCQRYYQKLGGGGNIADIQVSGYAPNTSAPVACTIGINAMRAAPTATVVGTFSTGGPIGSVTLTGGLQTLGIQLLSNAAGQMSWYTSGTSTYITLAAEL